MERPDIQIELWCRRQTYTKFFYSLFSSLYNNLFLGDKYDGTASPNHRHSVITKNDDRRHERATAGAAAGMPYNHAYTDKAELGPDRAREAGMGRIRRYVVVDTQLTLDSVMAEYITVLITNGADRDRVHTEMDDCKSTLVQN